MEQLGAAGLFDALAKIAFVQSSATNQAGLGYGDPCPSGINLQWASIASSGRVVAKVFERGEGPTASSGTSATAVACAAWMVGLVQPGIVEIEMPGGVAPVRLEADGRELRRVSLFGTAVRLAS
jgi:diaminopimelate epimerase